MLHSVAMSTIPNPDDSAATGAERELALVQTQIDESRVLLDQFRQALAQGEDDLRGQQDHSLVKANEQLVLSMLRSQVEAETAARDIAFREKTTELRLESQRLGEENRLMVEASRLKTRFLANMSHEMRTPLNAIMGFAEILQLSASPVLSPTHLEYLEHIRTSGGHLLEIVNDILDLTTVAAGQLDFHPEPVDPQLVVREVVDMLESAARRKSVVVHTQIEPGLSGIVLDRTRLKQALSNYLSNAIKFSHRGGTVTLRVRAEGDGQLRFEVEDGGIGIAAADQSRLFVEFQQIDSNLNRKHQGTGLGLALTRLLVEAQGGTVGVRSTLGAGSTFHFVLRRDARPVSEPL